MFIWEFGLEWLRLKMEDGGKVRQVRSWLGRKIRDGAELEKRACGRKSCFVEEMVPDDEGKPENEKDQDVR